MRDSVDMHFDEYKRQFANELITEKVEYFGINVSSDEETPLSFKIYYRDSCSHKITHPLLEFLKAKDMLRYTTAVCDSGAELEAMRFDIGMKNRTDSNLESVLIWLRSNSFFCAKQEEQIRRVASMIMTQKSGFSMASLYFLGLIARKNEIEMLKFHFFNRICEDPDVLHKNLRYADDYYLNFLKEAGNSQLAFLSEIMRLVLSSCGGHLWMTGIDYKKNGDSKYKIYLKSPKHLYDALEKALSEKKAPDYSYNTLWTRRSKAIENIIPYLASITNWNTQRQEYKCEGFALCLDDVDVFSLNFYYRIESLVQ